MKRKTRMQPNTNAEMPTVSPMMRGLLDFVGFVEFEGPEPVSNPPWLVVPIPAVGSSGLEDMMERLEDGIGRVEDGIRGIP